MQPCTNLDKHKLLHVSPLYVHTGMRSSYKSHHLTNLLLFKFLKQEGVCVTEMLCHLDMLKNKVTYSSVRLLCKQAVET